MPYGLVTKKETNKGREWIFLSIIGFTILLRCQIMESYFL